MTSHDIDVGSKIRSYRKKRGFSLTDLSRMTGIAASNLSAIELNKSSPTLRTLIRIAQAFDLKAGAFLDDALHEKAIVVRKGQGKKMEVAARGQIIEALTDPAQQGLLEAKIVTLQPGAEPFLRTDESAEHLIYCLHGKPTAFGHGQDYELRAGDSLVLYPDGRVRFENRGSKEAALLMVRAVAARGPRV